jgi:predicted amidohydrolase YtcJ
LVKFIFKHLFHLANRLHQIDLRSFRSIESIREALVNASTESEWIIGYGWDHNHWGTEFPTSRDLDSHPILSRKKIVLGRADYHAVWVNGNVLKLLPALNASDDVITDSSGNLTGIFLDDAMNWIEPLLPVPSFSQWKDTLPLAFQYLLSFGITSVHDAGLTNEKINILFE